MAIAAAMNNQQNNKQDEHEQDIVMPGFRFHPTEEELVEFYLRRKVEGKRFNVELITFIDLYRYDPWELPALAAIGEKEWYFYVPRDRKYRNGDRPNRVTTSGYWKATGADRMIKSENLRSIGLKKTLVFYSGKAPKGIRTSWIMNEYRLPHHETERLQKAEISLCRVYKRAGVDDHASLPRSLPTKSKSKNHTIDIFQATYGGSSQQNDAKIVESSPSSSADIGTNLALSQQNSYAISPIVPMDQTPSISPDDDHRIMMMQQSKNSCSNMIFSSSSSHAIDDLHKLVNNYSINHENHDQYNINPNILVPHFSNLQPPAPQQQAVLALPGSLQAAFSDRLWDWSGVSEAGKDYTNLFNCKE
ncbi:hypothetical protein CDL12_23819 [Handroanthus impetiginosus]|uniref:NAC domain-containing protein n=1 Tax=Handroanthus impetiginosus TaxID=429701 RepID=A0A2G9GEF3_9LAMI|nr:hypothetical protein CDL12_23819 [Handroanthus impetiginosus]